MYCVCGKIMKFMEGNIIEAKSQHEWIERKFRCNCGFRVVRKTKYDPRGRIVEEELEEERVI